MNIPHHSFKSIKSPFERMDDIGPEPSYEDIIRKEVASIRQEHNLPDTDVETSDLSSQVFVEYRSRRGSHIIGLKEKFS